MHFTNSLPNRRKLVTFPLLLCGLLASATSCSSHPSNLYTDRTYGFSLTVPPGWTAPPDGTNQAGQGYVVQFTSPCCFRIEVAAPIPKLLSVPNNKVVRRDGTICPQQCLYLHIAVAGYAGIRIIQTRIHSSFLFADYIIVNTKRHSYSLQLRANHISSRLDHQFGTLVKSLKLSSSG
jgi:hypothetical protein